MGRIGVMLAPDSVCSVRGWSQVHVQYIEPWKDMLTVLWSGLKAMFPDKRIYSPEWLLQ